jgi:hypothetical protein
MEPSGLGRPTAWHFSQPLVVAVVPTFFSSSVAMAFGWRFTPPGWYCSANATCSGVKSRVPLTEAHAGAA